MGVSVAVEGAAHVDALVADAVSLVHDDKPSSLGDALQRLLALRAATAVRLAVVPQAAEAAVRCHKDGAVRAHAVTHACASTDFAEQHLLALCSCLC